MGDQELVRGIVQDFFMFLQAAVVITSVWALTVVAVSWVWLFRTRKK